VTVLADDIRRMFSALAPRYDRFNRWSSLGLDNHWRRALAGRLSAGQRVLDVGCGTGDLSLLAFHRGCRVSGLDFSEEMLAVARRREPAVDWTRAGADKTPFPPDSFDAVLSAYVMRNLYRGGLLEGSLKESFRVLKAGGRVMFLDLTRPRNPLLRWGHGLYMKTALPLIGRAVCGPSWPGAYLRSSIEELPAEVVIRGLFEGAGFKDVEIIPLSGGIVSLFIGQKPC
jgi:demethylmenaquinone methyltransferase / 2-methoxy-6-polyprenyl-1,4-benzoquinol methylase